jgi:hypothetical protein
MDGEDGKDALQDSVTLAFIFAVRVFDRYTGASSAKPGFPNTGI